MMRRVLVSFAASLLLTVGGQATEPPAVALNFQDVELPVLARFVSEVTGRNFILDDRVRGTATIISPTPITPDEAYRVFQSVLSVKGFATVPSGDFVKIVPLRDAREAAMPPGTAGRDQLVTRVLALGHADAESVEEVLTPLISKDGLLTAHPTTNRLVIVDSAGNVERVERMLTELDRPATDQVTQPVRLRHASADAVASRLEDALAEQGSGRPAAIVPDPRTNTIVVSGTPGAVRRAHGLIEALDVSRGPGQHDLHVYRLRNASAERMVVVLSQLLGLPPPPPPAEEPTGSAMMRSARTDSPDLERADVVPVSTGTGTGIALDGPVRVTADPATNALLVSAGPRDWQTLASVIRDLDVPRRQVFVEAIILEATADKTRELGIEFRAAGTAGGNLGLAQVSHGVLGTASSDPTSLPGLILAAVSERTITLANGDEVPASALLLSALQRDSDLDILSAPNIVTTDNEEAEIVVGQNVPFVASRATDATNLENTFTTIVRHDVGITLRMTPQIIADDFVRLNLFEEVSAIDEEATFRVGDPNELGPTTTIRSTSTVVAARDGQTVVIGGLLADTLRTTVRSVPYLGEIPVLGNFFRSESNRRVKTNLLVFLTPHIIASDWEMAMRAGAQRSSFPDGERRPLLSGPSWEVPER